MCDCELGFGAAAASRKGQGGGGAAAAVWAGAAAALEGFLADPWLLRPAGAVDADAATVQVEVPPLEPDPEDGEDEARRAAEQRGAAAAEDLARRFESGAYGSPVSGSLSPSLPWLCLPCPAWLVCLLPCARGRISVPCSVPYLRAGLCGCGLLVVFLL